MKTRNTTAGGLFLMLSIVVGTLIGVIVRLPMEGVLIGTGVGIALALLVWIVDWQIGLRHAPRRPDDSPDRVD